MKVSELIMQLRELQDAHGDLPVLGSFDKDAAEWHYIKGAHIWYQCCVPVLTDGTLGSRDLVEIDEAIVLDS